MEIALHLKLCEIAFMAQKPYQPKSSQLQEIRRLVSSENWNSRVLAARTREKQVLRILKLVESGKSQNESISLVMPESKRSSTLRDLSNYRQEKFEGLIDRRTPRSSEIPIAIRDAIEVARMANPNISCEEIEKILAKKYDDSPSVASIRRIWNAAGLQRRSGRPEGNKETQNEAVAIEELEAAGFQLLCAAEEETGAVSALVDTVMQVMSDLPEPS